MMIRFCCVFASLYRKLDEPAGSSNLNHFKKSDGHSVSFSVYLVNIFFKKMLSNSCDQEKARNRLKRAAHFISNQRTTSIELSCFHNTSNTTYIYKKRHQKVNGKGITCKGNFPQWATQLKAKLHHCRHDKLIPIKPRQNKSGLLPKNTLVKKNLLVKLLCVQIANLFSSSQFHMCVLVWKSC